MASVKLTNVKKIYGKNTGAVQDFNLDIADKVLVISGGTVSAYGSKEEILPGLLSVQSGCRAIKGASV